MAITKTKTGGARVTLNVRGGAVQQFSSAADASAVLSREIQKAVKTGRYRVCTWGEDKKPSVRALLRSDGSPVGISRISKPGRNGIQAAIYLAGNRSKLVRFVTVKRWEHLLPAFGQCVDFLVLHWSLDGRQRKTLSGSFAAFCKRYDLVEGRELTTAQD